jgi:SAM-dependent methyltransferase
MSASERSDVLLPTTGLHGGDVSSQRVDELDRACLEYLSGRRRLETTLRAIDIGGGYGAQSKRMAHYGADVVLVDLTDQSKRVCQFNSQIGREGIKFYQSDIRALRFADMLGAFDVIYSQRMLSCIPYRDARSLLIQLHDSSSVDAHCFISAGGLYTEIGNEYAGRTTPIEERWSVVSPVMAQKHQMFAPECLYSESELASLLESCGYTTVRSWTSTFGNPKVICKK